MIVYIIPGKTKTINNVVDYICDEKKTLKNFEDFIAEYETSPVKDDYSSFEQFYVSNVDNFNKAIQYIANEDKIGGYISGYLCNPNTCESEFLENKRKNLSRVGKSLEEDTGNYFYHIIQSFPEEIDIPDEEIHRCGLELVERLGLYQAVIASHIHPSVDEEGEVHGRCKHNHIVINSHIYHEFVDEDNPHKMKYNDCKETYAQLQLINDQIAIEHGLPIISELNISNSYSWFESKEKNKGKSWKARVKIDIDSAMRVSEDFDSFTKSMEAAGYSLRSGNSAEHGNYITYNCPDGTNKVRDYILGRGYTIDELESFWEIKRGIKKNNQLNQNDPDNAIEKILETTAEPLFIKFKKDISERRKTKLREKNINYRKTYTNYLPITSSKIYSSAEISYFDTEKMYQIVNSQHRSIAEVSGQEIREYYRRAYERQQQEKRDEEKRRKDEQSRAYYSNKKFVSTSMKRPYRIGVYDETGRKRTILELVIMLAIVTIQKEFGKWQPPKTPKFDKQEYTKNAIYAQKDWKIQNMVDTIRIAREENIQSPAEIIDKLNTVGKALSKCRAEHHRLTDAINNMADLYDAITQYKSVKEICESIQMMEDGEEKTKLQKIHAEDIEKYKDAKAIMYRHKVISEEEVEDFLERYTIMKTSIPRLEEEEIHLRSEYSKLNKLKYNVQLAQNRQYCYGPEYKEIEQDVPDQEEIKDNQQDEQRIE